ncbi:unnamed protein product [Urochloa humidicola]
MLAAERLARYGRGVLEPAASRERDLTAAGFDLGVAMSDSAAMGFKLGKQLGRCSIRAASKQLGKQQARGLPDGD